MEATWVSTDRGMDKEDMVHRYNGKLLSLEKEWNECIHVCITESLCFTPELYFNFKN